MLLRSILCAVPNTRPAPFSASRVPTFETYGAQHTPAADATLGHLVDLGVEIQVELVESPVAQVESQAALLSTRAALLSTRRTDLGLTKDERANRALQRSNARARRQQMLEQLGQSVGRASG